MSEDGRIERLTELARRVYGPETTVTAHGKVARVEHGPAVMLHVYAERSRRTYGASAGYSNIFIEEFGSPRAAIEAILGDVHGYRDFAPTALYDLLAWEMPYGVAIHRWHEIIACAERLLSRAAGGAR